jgi:glycosyltransferase involved in cell wall biosynthesis
MPLTSTSIRTTPDDSQALPAAKAGPGIVRVLVITQDRSVPSDRRVWNEILTLRSAGYEVVAISPQGNGRDRELFERRDGVDIHRYVQPPASGSTMSYVREYAGAAWHIRAIARRVAGDRGFDIVQASNPPDFLLLAVHFLKRSGARMIFDHHDLAPELYLARRGSNRLLYRLVLGLEWVSYRMADLVLATNESYKTVAVRRGGMRSEDVFVVGSGPDLTTFTPVPADPALRRGRRHLISFIGEMAPQDGLDQALRALSRLGESRDDWYAMFAGDGSAVEDLRRLTTRLGLDDRVEFVGWLQGENLRRLLCSSDVCLVPDPKTAFSDASTLVKIGEYMAMSRSIAAYDLTESRLTAGDAALYARPNDPDDLARAIAELLDDPDRRAEMGRIGRERVEQMLSWERASAEFLAAYVTALERQPSRWARAAAPRRRLAN